MDCKFRNKRGICTIGCEEIEVAIGDTCAYMLTRGDDKECPNYYKNWEFVVFNEKFVAKKICKLMREFHENAKDCEFCGETSCGGESCIDQYLSGNEAR